MCAGTVVARGAFALRRDFDEGSAGVPKNFTRSCLLLLVAEQPSHGYDLLERLGQLGVERPDPGGLYRALRAMEQEGLMRSRWEASELGPARRTYELTAEGEDWLHAWAGVLRHTRDAVTAYLDRYDALVRDGARRR